MNPLKKIRPPFSHPFALVIGTASLLSSCGSVVHDPRASAATTTSTTSFSQTMSAEGVSGVCMALSPHQNLGVTDSWHFQACRNTDKPTVITLEGYIDNTDSVCVFPLQTITSVNGTPHSVYKLDAYGAPYAECGGLNSTQTLKINFLGTTFDSLIVVPKIEKTNMQNCLKNSGSCGEYSFGTWN